MNISQLPLSFYQHLRNSGYGITLAEYHLLLEAMQAGLGLESKEDFLETCQLLWAKTPEQNEELNRRFDTCFRHVWQEKEVAFPSESSSNEQKKIADTDNKESTDTPQNVAPTANDEDANPKDTPKKQNQSGFGSQDAPRIAFYPPDEEKRDGENLDNLQYSPDEYLSSPYILSNDYLPISLRQLQQIWRNLRHYTAMGQSKKINWNQTVAKIAQQKFFISPAYEPMRVNQIQLSIIIDHHGSMATYEEFAEHLITAATVQGGFANAQIYYTHNLPINYLYCNPFHSASIAKKDFIANCSPKHSVVLFFSDAGAVRGTFIPERISNSIQFINDLKKNTKAIAWLNPMPKNRWQNTSAELIALLTPMFECTETDTEAAIKHLKSSK